MQTFHPHPIIDIFPTCYCEVINRQQSSVVTLLSSCPISKLLYFALLVVITHHKQNEPQKPLRQYHINKQYRYSLWPRHPIPLQEGPSCQLVPRACGRIVSLCLLVVPCATLSSSCCAGWLLCRLSTCRPLVVLSSHHLFVPPFIVLMR
jgi:hypothetical protein